MSAAVDTKPLATRELTITRIFDAPRELVFKAWTDPKQLAKWWGPKGFTNPVCEANAKPGGAIWIVMRAPDGTEYPMKGIFREIVEPERLVFVATPVDLVGTSLIEAITTVTFAEQGAKTRVTVHARAVALVAIGVRMIEGMEAGWSQSLDRLGELMAGTR
jgi:uncharacterized protein YndB with AHSA1/START domain